MKRTCAVLLGVALFVAGAVFGRLLNQSARAESVAVAQARTGQESKYDPKDPATWPASMDALAAAPHNHRVLLENERVRVLEVMVRPGEKEPIHLHRFPSVFYTEVPASYRLHDEQGKVQVDTGLVKQPSISDPLVLWLPPQGPHWVENYGKTVHRAIRIELKQ